ncbi:MAG TPA: response regulator [Flavobacterium sp.]|jgi:DNA-binding LytR/AlgR family response regulator
MVSILVVEDELIISHDMCSMLIKMGYDVIGDAMDYDEAISLLEKQTPDLILLDINLNGRRDGIDLATEINRRFQIPFIFTTSHSDPATLQRARETNPVNYLVKPFKQEQLYTAIEMGLSNAGEKDRSKESAESDGPILIKGVLFIKDKFAYTKLVVADIKWIKSDGNYLEIYTSDAKPALIRASMSNILERLHNDFLRCHKSYIINLQHLNRIEASHVIIGTEKIPISKIYSDELFRRLNIL